MKKYAIVIMGAIIGLVSCQESATSNSKSQQEHEESRVEYDDGSGDSIRVPIDSQETPDWTGTTQGENDSIRDRDNTVVDTTTQF